MRSHIRERMACTCSIYSGKRIKLPYSCIRFRFSIQLRIVFEIKFQSGDMAVSGGLRSILLSMHMLPRVTAHRSLEKVTGYFFTGPVDAPTTNSAGNRFSTATSS